MRSREAAAMLDGNQTTCLGLDEQRSRLGTEFMAFNQNQPYLEVSLSRNLSCSDLDSEVILSVVDNTLDCPFQRKCVSVMSEGVTDKCLVKCICKNSPCVFNIAFPVISTIKVCQVEIQ